MDFLVRVVAVIVTLMLIIMMAALMWQVFTRFVIKTPSIWTEEIARYSFMYMTLLGAALGVKNSEHFGLTLLSEKFKGKLKIVYMRFIVNGIIMICSIVMLVYGMQFTISYGLIRVSPTFLIPMAWVFVAIPISAALMFIFSLYNIIHGSNEDMKTSEGSETTLQA
jgi:TRAP-type C4-dicarboxylate transport system permease small subunit